MQEKFQNADEGGLPSQSALTFKKGKVLINSELIPCVLNIIEKSEKYCFLVTPFIESITYWQELIRHINEAYEAGKMIFIILKKPKKENQDDNDKIEEIKQCFKDKIELFLVDFLHSKIYLNEKQVLITSTNLETFSMKMNHEIGCLIDEPAFSEEIVNKIIVKIILKSNKIEHCKGKYSELISKSINSGNFLVNASADYDSPSAPSNESNLDENKNDDLENKDNSSNETSANNNDSEDKNQGHCILCGEPMSFNLSKPYHEECEPLFKNSNTGKYCHKCGSNKERVSRYYPRCRPCYDKSEKGNL